MKDSGRPRWARKAFELNGPPFMTAIKREQMFMLMKMNTVRR